MSKKKKQPLTKPIKQFCKVMIETSEPQEGFEDVTLYITFLNGQLKDMKYSLNIDLEDYREVGW
jgi:hypothetical protein